MHSLVAVVCCSCAPCSWLGVSSPVQVVAGCQAALPPACPPPFSPTPPLRYLQYNIYLRNVNKVALFKREIDRQVIKRVRAGARARAE